MEVPPPALFAGTLAAGLLLHRLLPFSIMPSRLARMIGMAEVFLGLGLGGAAVRTMRRAGTPIPPDEPSTTVVQAGPYRFSRNPIYLGMAILFLGISDIANAVWPMLLLPATLYYLTKAQIEREERYLEGRFGDQYRNYKARVRRWL